MSTWHRNPIAADIERRAAMWAYACARQANESPTEAVRQGIMVAAFVDRIADEIERQTESKL